MTVQSVRRTVFLSVLAGVLVSPPSLWARDIPCEIVGDLYYEALLDNDSDLSTGGPVTVVQGDEAPHDELGIDYRVQAYVVRLKVAIEDTLTVGDRASVIVPRAGAVVQIRVHEWTGANFQLASCVDTDYPVGEGEGLAGSDLVEWQTPWDAATPLGDVVFHSSLAAAPANDYTERVAIEISGFSVEIPTASSWAMALLALVLAGVGLVFVRRVAPGSPLLGVLLAVAGATLFAGVLFAATFVMDGENTDWAGIDPLVSDAVGDSSIDQPFEDLLSCFADRTDDGQVAFRCDVEFDEDVDI